MKKNKKNKLSVDFETGVVNREELEALLNSGFFKNGSSLDYHRLHSFLKNMTITEKKSNSRLETFLTEVDTDSAMGLSYILCKKEKSVRIPFLFIPSNARGLYVKIPRDYLSRSDTYISFLISLNYHVMLFSPISKKISDPLPLQKIAQRFKGNLLTSKGNRNRYVFSGFNPNKVTLHYLYENNPFSLLPESTVLEKLEGLFQ